MFALRAGVRVQLIGAALMWLIGSSILIVRGVGYLYDRYWHAWVLGIALILAVLKSRYLLDKAATKAVARIRARGTAFFFGFFSGKTWLMVAGMMGAGMTLRRLVVHPDVIGAGIMGALYLGIGAALFMADRIFWRAVTEPVPVAEEAVVSQR